MTMAKILLVDDNADLLTAMVEFLHDAEHESVVAANGDAAIQAFRTQHFDLVITDIVMPEKEGIETILELRRMAPGIRIIAMSGGNVTHPQTNLLAAQLLGATVTLNKPFTGKQLLEAVTRTLDRDA